MTVDPPQFPHEQALALVTAFEQAGVPYALGGAITLVYWAEPRGTLDIDVNVFVPESEASRILDVLESLGVAVGDREQALPLIERDGFFRANWAGTFVDLFFAYDAFHDSCRSRAREVDFLGKQVFVLSAEDIVVFKTMLGRNKDWPDIETVIAMQGRSFDLPYARRWLERILGADDSRIARLQELFEQYAEDDRDEPGE